MGNVYLVRDRETGERLALKQLITVDAKSVLRLKREFRALADVSHPNLVKVYELGHGDEGWFLAMEYVDGVDLRRYLGVDPKQVSGVTEMRSHDPSTYVQHKLLPTFHQLAQGIQALHRAGMLHRDLKPSNVLVASDRVVVLDFGLVRELDPKNASLTEDGVISGTPAYMAPEQALGKPLSQASDWYALGVMLYEALTGELPHDGPVFDLLRQKLESAPAAPRSIRPDIPEVLDALCMQLLSREPEDRPRGEEIIARLEPLLPAIESPVSTAVSELSLQTDGVFSMSQATFVGRSEEIARLWKALLRVDEGRAVVVHVRGASGAGKSLLVERFLDEVEQSSTCGAEDVLVLRSRCYEREATPFKALDGAIDTLTRHLTKLDDVEIDHILPMDVAALAQLFPVLGRLRTVQRLVSMRPYDGYAIHNRKKAEAALRELFSRIASHHRVVLWIDDLQWGDLDSARILKSWLQRCSDLPLMLLFSYRSDEVDTSQCLEMLLDVPPGTPVSEELNVHALSSQDIHALCVQKLGSLADGHADVVDHIVRESRGSPFWAAHLAALAEAKLIRGDADTSAISIQDVVGETMALLSPDARRLLAVLAIAGRPTPPGFALRAAGLRGRGSELVHALRRMQLVRTRTVGSERLLEVYHDRVRESVLGLMPPEQHARVHEALFSVLDHSGRADADWLHTLASASGNRKEALRYGLIAAERATSTLAFERAAELYRRCIELTDGSSARGSLYAKLAAVLGYCGRGSLAADAYLQAHDLAEGEDAFLLARRAMSHLLRSGRFTEGQRMLEQVLGAMDLRVPATKAGLARAVAWERFKNLTRGTRYTPRFAAQIPSDLLAKVDALDALFHDTASIDPLRAALFLEWQVRWALRLGERSRVLRALCAQCYMHASAGSGRSAVRAERLLKQATELAKQIDSDEARAHVAGVRSLVNWLTGHPQNVVEPSLEAERLYKSSTAADTEDSYHMRLAATSARVGALYELGQFRAFMDNLHAALQEANASDNVAAQLQLSLNETIYDELRGRPDAARDRLDRQRHQLPPDTFGLYHALHMIAVAYAAAASGQYEWGLDYLQATWPEFTDSPVSRSSTISSLALSARARLLAHAHLTGDGGKTPSLTVVRDSLRALRTIRSQPARQMADTQQARLHFAAGDVEHARKLLTRCIAAPSTVRPQAERMRYALGTMLGPDGAQLREQSRRYFDEGGVVDVDRYLRGYFPELLSDGSARPPALRR